MGTVTVSLPDALVSQVDGRDLIRRDLDRQHLRALLQQGVQSAPTAPADDDYFAGLRSRTSRRAT